MLPLAALALVAGAIGVAVAAPVGKLSFVGAKVDGQGGVTGISSTYGVAVAPGGKHLYALSGNGSVATFKRAPKTGKLSFVRAQSNGQVDSPGALAISRDGKNVYVSNTGNLTPSAILTYKRNLRTGRLRFVKALIDDQGGVDGLDATCCQIAISPDDRNVYVPGSGEDAIATFKRVGRKGILRFVDVRRDGQGGVSNLGDPLGVVVSPDGKNLYAISDDDNAVVTFKRNRKGKLRFIDAKVNGQNGVVDLDGPCCSLAISRDGRSVYIPAESGDSIIAFKRKLKTGRLRFQQSNLNDQGGITGMVDPLEVVVSRDGRNVYAASYADPSVIYRFNRARTGKLRFAQAIRKTDPGKAVIDGSWRLALSPDDRHLYAAAYQAHAVVTFKRRVRR